MIKLTKLAYTIEKIDYNSNDYEATLFLWYQDDEESLRDVKTMIKELYPEQAPVESFDYSSTYITWTLIEDTYDKVETLINLFIKDDQESLLYTSSEYKSAKELILTKLKYFDCSQLTKLEKYE